MLEGLLAAIAVFFAPQAENTREPTPLLTFDTGPSPADVGVIICKSPPTLWVEVIGRDQILIRYLGRYGGGETRFVKPAELPALLKKAGTAELGDRVIVSASSNVLYGDVVAQVGFLESLGVRKIALMGGAA